MRGRDAARELALKKSITKLFTIFHSKTKSIVNRTLKKIGWTEQKCIEMDELAQQDHTYGLSKEEFKRYQGQWYLTLNKSGKNAPMRLRSDFRAAVTIMNRPPRGSGEEVAEPMPLLNNIKDGTFLPQAIPGGTGTRPEAGGAHEWSIHFFGLLQ